MSEETMEITTLDPGWKTKVLVLGTVLGAAVGALGAYLFIQNQDDENEDVNLTAGQGVRLGVLVFGLLRNLANLGE